MTSSTRQHMPIALTVWEMQQTMAQKSSVMIRNTARMPAALCWGWVIALLLSTFDASARDSGSADTRVQSEIEYRALLRDAARQVADGREAWVLSHMWWPDNDTTDDRRLRAILGDIVATAQDDDPVLLRLAIESNRNLRDDPGRGNALLAQLRAREPDNALNGLIAMGFAPEDLAALAYDQLLQEMATAPRYAGDYMALMRAGYRALARARSLNPEATQAATFADHSDAPLIDGITAVSAAVAAALPGFQRLLLACNTNRFPDRTTDCRATAERMLADGDTAMERILAIALLRQTARDSQELDQAKALRRQWDWQHAAMIKVLWPADGLPDAMRLNRHLDELFARGELSAMSELLNANGIPSEPPSEWHSSREISE